MKPARAAGTAPSDLPPVLEGFEHINRYWDPSRGMFAAKILPGEFYVSRHDELVATVLGSCISACIRDPLAGVGGMNHFMLPGSTDIDENWDGTRVSAATRYGSHAMEHLINQLLALGARRDRLEVKLVGGGNVLAAATNIGSRNVRFAEDYVRLESLKVIGRHLGGKLPRKVIYGVKTGRALVKELKSQHNRTITVREQRYRDSLEREAPTGNVELF